jgi:hypothetical protein
MKSILENQQPLLVLSAVVALAPVAHAQITGFNVDFNGADTTYTGNFVRSGDSAVGTTGLNWSADGGVGGSGGLVVTEISGRNIFYRPDPGDDTTSTFDLAAAAASFTTSIDFKWADTSATDLSVITAGFVPANTSQTALTSSGALAGSIIRNGTSTVTLRMRNGNANANTLDFNQTALTAGAWYRLSYEVTKSDTEGVFDYTISLFSIGADGLSTPVLFNDGEKDITISGSVSNSVLYSDENAFFAYDIRGGSNGISHVDNFFVGSAIPEPSAFAVIAGFGALATVGLRRRRSS